MTEERIEQALTTLALSMVDIRADVDAVAEKLRDVVEALIAADELLSGRLDRLELDNGTWPVLTAEDEAELTALAGDEEPSATQPGPPLEPSWWRKVLAFIWSPAQ